MEHKFRDILEHDMDMLILEEFACSNKFAKIFLNKVGIDNTKGLVMCYTFINER